MINRETRYKAVVHYKHFDRSLRRVAKLYKVSRSSLHRWINQDPVVRPRKRHRRSAFDDVQACVEMCVTANPFITMSALSSIVAERCNVKRCGSSFSRYVKQCRFTRKNAYRVVDANHTVEEVLPFCRQHMEAGNQLVCIDEAGFQVGDHGRRGYALRGRRLNIAGRKIQHRKYTLIMAVSSTGIVKYEILDHNCKKPDFVRFIRTLPVPSGTTLLMDNLKCHHSQETLDAIREKGCKPLYIPTYSPKFNAIENCFGTIKQRFRSKCPPQPNMETDYKQIMIQVLNEFQSTDLSAYFRHAQSHSEVVVASSDVRQPVLGYDVR